MPIFRKEDEYESVVFTEEGEKKKKLFFKNPKSNEEIQINTWGEKNDTKLLPLISWYLHRLKYYRLLNIDEGHAELSHDTLAKVINGLFVDGEMMEVYKLYHIYKKQFDNSFENYESSGLKKNYLLTENQIARYDEDKMLTFIFSEEDKDLICLLYTSPSPRDATLSRMPSSA